MWHNVLRRFIAALKRALDILSKPFRPGDKPEVSLIVGIILASCSYLILQAGQSLVTSLRNDPTSRVIAQFTLYTFSIMFALLGVLLFVEAGRSIYWKFRAYNAKSQREFQREKTDTAKLRAEEKEADAITAKYMREISDQDLKRLHNAREAELESFLRQVVIRMDREVKKLPPSLFWGVVGKYLTQSEWIPLLPPAEILEELGQAVKSRRRTRRLRTWAAAVVVLVVCTTAVVTPVVGSPYCQVGCASVVSKPNITPCVTQSVARGTPARTKINRAAPTATPLSGCAPTPTPHK